MSKEHKNDPDNYRELSEPFTNSSEAQAATHDFFDLVHEARNKCHITDVYVIVSFNVRRDGGEEKAITSAHFGNSLNSESMCAWALGQEQAEREALIGHLLRGASE